MIHQPVITHKKYQMKATTRLQHLSDFIVLPELCQSYSALFCLLPLFRVGGFFLIFHVSLCQLDNSHGKIYTSKSKLSTHWRDTPRVFIPGLLGFLSLEQTKCCIGRLLNGPSGSKSTIALALNVLCTKLKCVALPLSL